MWTLVCLVLWTLEVWNGILQESAYFFTECATVRVSFYSWNTLTLTQLMPRYTPGAELLIVMVEDPFSFWDRSD